MVKFKSASLITLGFLAISFVGCNNNATPVDELTENTDEISLSQRDGVALMEEKCFVCHFKTPDPSRKGEMIAPPMLRVQEHYKPVYPNKSEFVAAVMGFVNDPLEENTLMPGAIRKFNIMPKAAYDQAELELIAEAIFEMDFDKSFNGGMHKNGLALNSGKKWELKSSSIALIHGVASEIDGFESVEITAFNEFGKEIFQEVKTIMADDDYTGDLFDQIHNFFGGIEGCLHTLMSAESVDEAHIQLTELKIKFNEFDEYFE